MKHMIIKDGDREIATITFDDIELKVKYGTFVDIVTGSRQSSGQNFYKLQFSDGEITAAKGCQITSFVQEIYHGSGRAEITALLHIDKESK